MSRSPLLLAWLLMVAVLVGIACGWSEVATRSPVLLYEDAAALVEPSPMAHGVKGRATWYASRCPDGVPSFLGRRDTCRPYLSKEDGGRGGELVLYAAVGWWRWKMTPVMALVYFHKTGRTVRVVVRDWCGACAAGRSLIDLSPSVFILGGLTLGEGVARVSVRYLGAR